MITFILGRLVALGLEIYLVTAAMAATSSAMGPATLDLRDNCIYIGG